MEARRISEDKSSRQWAVGGGLDLVSASLFTRIETSEKSYGARPWGELFCLSVVSCLMPLALIALLIHYQDEMFIVYMTQSMFS